jgi:hypothetical protein
MTTRPNPFQQFLLLFQKLKTVAGNPGRLATFYEESAALRDTVAEFQDYIGRSGQFESRILLSGPKRFSQVPAEFEAEWRDYKNQWEYAIANAQLGEMIGARLPFTPPPHDRDDAQEMEDPDPEQDEEFDPRSHDGGAALRLGIDYLWSELDACGDQVRSGEHSDYAKLTANKCRIALDAFDYLKNVIGVDIDEVFRRWREVPTVFMPSHVSNKHGREKGSLNDLLDNAVRAFVSGAPAAAIATCRAILEMVLKIHYLPDDCSYVNKKGEERDKPLGDLIVLAEKKYDSLSRFGLTTLKDRGDAILHRYHRNEPLSRADENAILEYMHTLKMLIQRVGRIPDSERPTRG